MNIEEFQEYCLSFEGVSEDHPFDDEDVLAFKVMDKIFAFFDQEKFDGINLKCDPVKAAMLRGLYSEIEPGSHISKRHWNMVDPEGGLDDELIKEWIKDSYQLAVDDLPRKKQKKLEKLKD